jgi:eukaryotic-like serine/threonine-protein kinase
VLAAKYRVERVLGSGGMGVVVAARHEQLDVLVALKFMADDALGDPDLVARFLREARAAARLRSEHVARVTDVGTLESGAPYQVMEYLDGRDLSALLSSEGPLPIPTAVEYVIHACEALDEAHRFGIVHRDIKPSNLFLTKRPNGTPCIKVLDFGISKSERLGASSAKLHGTHSRSLLGSPSYMAPEQMRASRGVDARADIWALGATLYELLTGQVPFEAESLLDLAIRIAQSDPRLPHEIRPEIPWALEQVILRCLEKDRTDRFSTTRVLASALAPFASHRVTAVPDAESKEQAECDDTAPESSGETLTRVAASPWKPEVAAEPAPTAREPAPRDPLARPLEEKTRGSRGSTPVARAGTTAPMPVVVQESSPPVTQSVPRGWRTGARVSWGRSHGSARNGPRVLWGMAAIGILCGATAVVLLRSHRPSSTAREIPPASAVDTMSLPRTANNAAVRPPAIGAEPSLAPAQPTGATEPTSRIPTVSVTDLPLAPFAAVTPPAPRPAVVPTSSPVPTVMVVPTKPDCVEPYSFDEHGIKKFKSECIDRGDPFMARAPSPPSTAPALQAPSRTNLAPVDSAGDAANSP